jgi:aminoglycoside phosphotransferase (APT) family kinase protein
MLAREMTVNLQIDQPGPVREGEQLDASRLEPYLRQQLSAASGPLQIEQFPSGYSNLTYLVRLGDREMVLRRSPFGNAVKGAHDMAREYRILSRLCDVYPLAPRPYVFCDDETVLGTAFYVMERRQGVILRKSLPAGITLEPATCRSLSQSFIDNLARLHAIDFRAAGLGDLGRPEGFVQRQVQGWSQRYGQAQTEDHADMDRTSQWLAANMPPERGASLIHNDYKYDNLILDAHDLTRVVAVLDWEMTTLGDPLMDVGCTLAYWVNADDAPRLQQTAFGPTNLPGSMTRRELVLRYAQISERDVPDMLFYYVYGLFKLAVIVQQIHARYVRGHTRDARFERLNEVVAALAHSAAQAVAAGRI